MSSETNQLVRMSILGSVALLPLLVLPTMVGALVDYIGFTEAEAGWIAAVGFAGSATGAIAAGLRIRHFDPRQIAIAGLVMLAVFDAASVLANDLPTWVFLIFRFVSGVGGAIAYAAVMASIASLLNPERGYGIFMVFQFAVSSMGLYGLPYILPVTGVEGLFAIMAAAALASLTLRDAVIRRETVVDEPAIELKTILKPAALLAMCGIGLFETANLMHYTYDERIGLDFGLLDFQIGRTLGLATLLGVPAAFAVVWIGDRFGSLKPLFASLVLCVVGLLILLFPLGVISYSIAMYVLAMSWAFGLPYFYAIEARLDSGGSVVVVGGFFTSIGAAIGPAIAAALVSPDSYETVLVVAMLFYGVVAVLMAAAVRIQSNP